jgi:hypothetical protein
MKFLGYTISFKGIFMDPRKVQTIVEWHTPSFVHDVHCFLGIANFYYKFICNYSKIVLPLTQLTKKNQAFVWTPEADKAFTQLKEAFISAPALAHVDPTRPFTIVANAFDFALGSIIS